MTGYLRALYRHIGEPARRKGITSVTTEGETVVNVDRLFKDESFQESAHKFKVLFDRIEKAKSAKAGALRAG